MALEEITKSIAAQEKSGTAPEAVTVATAVLKPTVVVKKDLKALLTEDTATDEKEEVQKDDWVKQAYMYVLNSTDKHSRAYANLVQLQVLAAAKDWKSLIEQFKMSRNFALPEVQCAHGLSLLAAGDHDGASRLFEVFLRDAPHALKPLLQQLLQMTDTETIQKRIPTGGRSSRRSSIARITGDSDGGLRRASGMEEQETGIMMTILAAAEKSGVFRNSRSREIGSK